MGEDGKNTGWLQDQIEYQKFWLSYAAGMVCSVSIVGPLTFGIAWILATSDIPNERTLFLALIAFSFILTLLGWYFIGRWIHHKWSPHQSHSDR